MTWKDYKTYLDNNIIDQEEENISFKEEIKDKYNMVDSHSGEANFTVMINRFYRSLEATLDNEEDYHHLPTYQEGKTWDQLFPNQNEINWGAKTKETKRVEKDVYDCLWNIFEEWQNEQEENLEEEEIYDSQFNWEEYKYWLNHGVLEQNEEGDYHLTTEIKNKYQIKHEAKLITTLNDLIDSIENKSDKNYYPLPNFCSKTTDLKGNERVKVKSWKELFPQREKTLLGRKDRSDIKILDHTTFELLGNIYDDHVRPAKLTQVLDEEVFMEKFMMEAIIHLNYELIKKKGYDKLLSDWLNEYEKLDKDNQENLAQQKTMATEFLQIINEESQSRQEKEAKSSYWEKIKEHGYTIAIVGVGILIILLAWGYLKNKFWGK